MPDNPDQTAEFLQELQRVLGPPDGTVFYSIGAIADDLTAEIERLRTMPSGIGYHALLRRLGGTPPDDPPVEPPA
jgi:hypothetical protein